MTQIDKQLFSGHVARPVQARRLSERLIRTHRRPGEITLRFDAGAADDVREFVAAESRCCGFFGFEVSRTDTEVRLRVTAPAAAQPMLDALAAVFADDASVGAHDAPSLPQQPGGA